MAPPDRDEFDRLILDFERAWWENRRPPRPEDYAAQLPDPAEQRELEKRLRQRQLELFADLNQQNSRFKSELEKLPLQGAKALVSEALTLLRTTLDGAATQSGPRRARLLWEFLVRAFWQLFRSGVEPNPGYFRDGLPTEDQEIVSRAFNHFSRSDSWRFRPIEEHILGVGGQAQILEGRDDAFNRMVALKRVTDGEEDHEDRERRLEKEAHITACLDHPGVPTVFGIGRDGTNRLFFAMEFIDGKTLEEHVRGFHGVPPGQGRRSHRQCRRRNPRFLTLLRHFLVVCETVGYAHQRGILHRDLKPSNMMLGQFGTTYVIDWGLARRPNLPLGENDPPAFRLGTPEFMSPEQARLPARILTCAADVYSLGVTLYVLLTSARPADCLDDQILTEAANSAVTFSGEPVAQEPAASMGGVSQDVLSDKILRLVRELLGNEAKDASKVKFKVNEVRLRLAAFPDYPKPRAVNRRIDLELEQICLRAMHKDPKHRYTDASDLARALDRWLRDLPPKEREPGIAGWLGRVRTGVPRWLRRHPTLAAVGLVAAVLLSLLSAVGYAAYWDRRTSRQTKELLDTLEPVAELSIKPNASPQFWLEVQNHVKRYYEVLLEKTSAQPNYLERRLKARRKLAELERQARHLDEAEAQLNKALEELEQAEKSRTWKVTLIHRRFAETLHELGEVQAAGSSKDDKAHATYEQALTRWRKLELELLGDGKDEARGGRARVRGFRGDMYWERYKKTKDKDDLNKAKDDYKKSDDIRSQILKRNQKPANPGDRQAFARWLDAQRQYANSCNNLARANRIQWQQNDHDASLEKDVKYAIDKHEEALRLQKELIDATSDLKMDKSELNRELRSNRRDALQELAKLQLEREASDQAKMLYEEAVRTNDDLLREGWDPLCAVKRLEAVMGAVEARSKINPKDAALWEGLGSWSQIENTFALFRDQQVEEAIYKNTWDDFQKFNKKMGYK